MREAIVIAMAVVVAMLGGRHLGLQVADQMRKRRLLRTEQQQRKQESKKRAGPAHGRYDIRKPEPASP